MSLTSLANDLFERPGLQKKLEPLVREAAAFQLGDNFLPCFTHEQHDWDYLLRAASFLGASDRPEPRDAAVRIVLHALQHEKATITEKQRAHAVLDAMENAPTISLAKSRNLLPENIEKTMPVPAIISSFRRHQEGTIWLHDNKQIRLNTFQRKIWGKLASGSSVSISAPTSSGKSYLLYNWVLERSLTATINIIYVVPTRALINQVHSDLLGFLSDREGAHINITSLPMKEFYNPKTSNVFIFTQERLNLFLDGMDINFTIDALVIDEAHKVGDDLRGVILQLALERVAHVNRRLQVVFASPFTENPEALLSDLPKQRRSLPLKGIDQPVPQNLFWLFESREDPTNWHVRSFYRGEPTEMGRLQIGSAPPGVRARLPQVAFAVAGATPGNLIYANGPGEAEEYALILYNLIKIDFTKDERPDLHELSELAEIAVHRKFLLRQTAKRGVAFHYGNMPQLLRIEIERLFASGALRYLVCTSTLIEGVNMACRNIFVRGPKKGNTRLMEEGDFWNLAGRAGRWGKEFAGNIFCVDATTSKLWLNGCPPTKKTPIKITRAVDEALSQVDRIVEYSTRTDRNITLEEKYLETVLSYVVTTKLRFGSLRKSPWSKRYPDEVIAALEEVADEVILRYDLPHNIILRNPGIDPLAMMNLFAYFQGRTKPVAELLPIDPLARDAVSRYSAIFFRCGKYLGSRRLTTIPKRNWQLALTVVRWMNGYPLRQLISDRIENDKKNTLPAKIRKTLEDVENVARFEAPKYIGCYNDVLRHFLSIRGEYELLERTTNLSVMLEFGVSQQTHISLMSLGFSRTSAIEIGGLLGRGDLTEGDCIALLADPVWEMVDLPALVVKEIEHVRGLHKRRFSG